MSSEYDAYLVEHKENVEKGLEWLRSNLPKRLVNEEAMQEALSQIHEHDESKRTHHEYEAYDDWFYNERNNRSDSVKDAFNRAWLHHIHNNPHHWQHWVLVNDDPEEGSVAIEMPLNYVYEMIADWWSFSWTKGNLTEIFSWYKDHKDYMILHENTEKAVRDILTVIRDILKMQLKKTDEDNFLKHSDDEEKDYGIPELKKYPMPDRKHVISAIKFFNYVDPQYEQELANTILEKIKEYNMNLDSFGVGEENRFKKYISKDYLEHHGIQGQRWGVRRYQNSDGSLTEAGKMRYRSHAVFISGSSKTQSEDSEYYLKELPKSITDEIDSHIAKGNKIIVGDAPGIDRQVQNYLDKADYDNVEVYGPGKKVRYTANEKWKTNPIDVPDAEEGSKEWLAAKDIAMEKAADEGLAIILDNGANATRRNVQRLLNDNKDVKVFSLSASGRDYDSWIPKKLLIDILPT